MRTLKSAGHTWVVETIVSLESEDRAACASDIRAHEEGMTAAKERDAVKRFGLISFEEYLSWVISQSAARRA